MTMKPFEIQSTSLSINGVLIDTSATGNLVIPGLTRATALYADEVEDTNDQTRTWSSFPYLMDAYLYDVSQGLQTPAPSFVPADYSGDGLDGDGYIDGINVDTPGSFDQTVADYIRNNDMYAYIGSNVSEPFNPSNWVQIPFRVRTKANEVEYEFSTGGGASNLSDLDDVEISDPQDGEALVWDNNDEKWKNQTVSGGSSSSTGNITFDGDTISSTGYGVDISNNLYTQLRSNGNYLTVDNNGIEIGVSINDLANANKFKFLFNNGQSHLQLPAGGDIVDSNGTSVLGGGGSGVAGLSGDTSFTPDSSGDTAYELNINNQIKLRTTYSGDLGPGIALGDGAGSGAATGVIAIGNQDTGLRGKQGGVYIGYQAGWNDSEAPQGEWAIAIGAKAARNIALDNSITLNATGVALDPDEAGLFIKPIREEQYDDQILFYNPTSGEVTYAANTLSSSKVVRQDTPPTATDGTLWFNTVEGRLYIKYNDAWVDAAPLMMPAPEQNPEFNSITFSDSSVQTTAFTGNKLVNGSYELVLNSNGDLLSANDFIATPDGRFVKDCGNSGSTTSMRWINIPTDQEVQVIRAYSGNPGSSDNNDSERGTISVEWQSATESGWSITAFDHTDGVDESKWTFTGFGDLEIPGDITSTSPFGVYSEVDGENSGLYITGGGSSIVYASTDVIIRSNNNTQPLDWTFGSDGSTTFGSGSKLTGDGSTFTLDSQYTDTIDLRDNTGTGFYTNSHTYKIQANAAHTWTFSDTGKTIFPITSVPSSSRGAVGDLIGSVAFDGNHMYYCKATYTNGLSDIWVRTAWGESNW